MTKARVSELEKQLESDIVTGVLAPGSRLDEPSLAERFGVSRTPVREALNRLVSIGLVEMRPRRGAVVAAVGLKDLVEMFEVMAELEGACGRLATRRLAASERLALQRIHEDSHRFVDAGDIDGYYAVNVAFHEAIYRASHNRFLAEQTMALRNRLAPYRRLQLRRNDRLGESFAEHAAILAAIGAGDAAAVETLLRTHVTVQSGSYADFIASLPVDLVRRAS